MLLAFLFLSKRSSNHNHNNNNNNNNSNNNKALSLLLWRGLRRKSLPGSGRGKRSAISGEDKDGRLAMAAAGTEEGCFGFFFFFLFCATLAHS